MGELEMLQGHKLGILRPLAELGQDDRRQHYKSADLSGVVPLSALAALLGGDAVRPVAEEISMERLGVGVVVTARRRHELDVCG